MTIFFNYIPAVSCIASFQALSELVPILGGDFELMLLSESLLILSIKFKKLLLLLIRQQLKIDGSLAIAIGSYHFDIFVLATVLESLLPDD